MSEEKGFDEKELDNIMNEIEDLESELKEDDSVQAAPEAAVEPIASPVEEVVAEEISEEPSGEVAEEVLEEVAEPAIAEPVSLQEVREEAREEVSSSSEKKVQLSIDHLEDVQLVLSLNGQDICFNIKQKKSEICIELNGGAKMNLPLSCIKSFAA